ncbi:MAG: glycosyltransferase [Prevotella sp.]|nr:glycosyltransferase [Prevotella sp.]
MIKELSILIPVYNACPDGLAAQAAEQAERIAGLNYEIIVGDDGSDDPDVIRKIDELGHINRCRILRFDANRGRAAIRNSLAGAANHSRLLFIDGAHMRLCGDNYIEEYLSCGDDCRVVYGGYCLSEPDEETKRSNLRYKYESRTRQNRSAQMRNAAPGMDFHTCNFLVRKDVFGSVRFDERLVRYGYEDVLMGKNLTAHGIQIHHISNPTRLCGYEDNATFLRKTVDSLLTLKEFETELDGYSRLLNNVRLCRKLKIDSRLRSLYLKRKDRWTDNLTGNNPSLTVFRLFKLGFFLSL